MSKNESVSVPRELAEQAAYWLEALSERSSVECATAEDLRALLAQPAAQHQGEPVALPERKITNVLNYHASLGASGWNNCLDEIAKLGPLYATTGEVERLREDLTTVKAGRDAYAQNAIDLRAQLAERDALLREALPALDLAAGAFKSAKPVRNKVRATLSASAEPCAPKSCGACVGCNNGCQLDKDSPVSTCLGCGVPGFTGNCDKCFPC